MGKASAGLLMYRVGNDNGVEVFLVHPGGPFWQNKDLGAWSIPKGEYLPEEDPLAAARREFAEETGIQPGTRLLELTPVKQAGGKLVRAWAFEGDADPATISSNTFTIEWPPKSGRQQSFSEIDRAAWFQMEEAKQRINKGQLAFLEELPRVLSAHPKSSLEHKTS